MIFVALSRNVMRVGLVFFHVHQRGVTQDVECGILGVQNNVEYVRLGVKNCGIW